MSSTPPNPISTRINPKTGMRETYEIPQTPKDSLEKFRKEVRDYISGNVQWFDDPYTSIKPKSVPESVVEAEDDQ